MASKLYNTPVVWNHIAAKRLHGTIITSEGINALRYLNKRVDQLLMLALLQPEESEVSMLLNQALAVVTEQVQLAHQLVDEMNSLLVLPPN